ATGDHAGAAVGDLDPVTVSPDPWVRLEVARAVALAVGVVPERDRHRGHRLGDHELAALPDHRPAVRVERLDLRAEAPALELPGVDRQRRGRSDETRGHIRSHAHLTD